MEREAFIATLKSFLESRLGAGVCLCALACLAVLGTALGGDLVVTSPKGCEIAAWSRNLAEGQGFVSGSHWLGEVLEESPEGATPGHYPPLPALLQSVPLHFLQTDTLAVLLLSLLAFVSIPIWIGCLSAQVEIHRGALLLAGVAAVFFPPFLQAAFQPDGEILLALLGALVLSAFFRHGDRTETVWAGLIAGTALNISLDALALLPCGLLALGWAAWPERKTIFRSLGLYLLGWLPGMTALGWFLLNRSAEGFSWGGIWRNFWLLSSSRELGVQRVPLNPTLWIPPDPPGGWFGTVLDGLARHSEAALATLPVWGWGILAIGLLTGQATLRRRIAVALSGWAALWLFRALRSGEETEAFLLFSVWLLILCVETLFRILEALVEYKRLSPQWKTAALGTVVLLTWWPGFFEIRQIRAQMKPEQVELENRWAARVRDLTAPDTLLVTDTPERLAWKTGRETVWLPVLPKFLEQFGSLEHEVAVVLTGAIASARDVDPLWWDHFEQGIGAAGFTDVMLDEETYTQIWRRPGLAPGPLRAEGRK